MGVPAPLGVGASGKSPLTGDMANGVIQGSLAALGPTKPFAFLGPMNLAIWGEFTDQLTTTAADLSAVLATTVAAGSAINSSLVPRGTTVGSVVATDIEMVLPTVTFQGKIINGVAKITDLADTSDLLGAVVSGTGVVSGQTVTAIDTASVAPSPNVPNGIKGTVSLSAVTTAAQPGDQPTPYEFALAAAGAVPTGVDAAAIITGAAIGLTGSVQLERSFDGGATWILCNIGGSGALAQWNPATPISLSFGEPENMVLYRLNLTAVTPSAGVALKYRISETGQAARTLSVPLL